MIDPQTLPDLLKFLAVFSVAGGIISCVYFWPSLSEREIFIAGPLLYTYPVIYLLSGLLGGLVFWSLGDIVYRLRILTGTIQITKMEDAEDTKNDTEQE